MLQKDNRYKVLKAFFENPLPKGGFQLRELSRKTNIAPPSVKRYLTELEKEGLIKKTIHRIHKYPLYQANRDSQYFKFLKKIDTITSIKESGLLDHLHDQLMPDTIILFGSASKGEDTEGSDIDIFIQSPEKNIDLAKYEKKLNRKITPFFKEKFLKLSPELKNNILNGIILQGYLKVF